MFSQNSGALIFVFAKEALLPKSFLLPANVLYCTFFGSSMALFAIHFIYRYLAVTGSNLIKNHNRKVIIFLLLFPLSFGFFWYLLSHFTLGPFEEGDLFVRKYYLVDHDIQLSEIHYVGYYFYPEDAYGNTTMNWKCIVGCAIEASFINVSFGIIFYYGYKCYRHTKSASKKFTTSSSHISLQTQLFYALVFQTVIPVFLMHIPSTISISAAFSNISFESLSQMLACTISLYPALDPLPNFFIIKSYRLAILGFFKRVAYFIVCRKANTTNIIKVQTRNELFMSNASKTIMT
ncbi:hypothetical protein GCK72_018690 [Caenorhabditis remanei]|uniref:Seven TM Receptor n=1 Tax=Caenorhabditis remanei TaxID=31234 RepID=A0A6A5GBB3_CAERE|nr:hypothetical protein GCK72_018690 [Caenorhabditis remanei]KAF1752136.1 hypothetical protein GCK72_018690 [Caenorhabditis remanei]